MKKILFALLAVAAIQSALAKDDDASPAAVKLSVVVSRLAKFIGRDLKWEATYDPKISVDGSFEPKSIDEFGRAIRELNKILEGQNPELLQRPPLRVCVLEGVVMVRTEVQPPCDEPLN